jgi:surface polysaccharide O-acyltransferase-like enzyme
VSSMTQQQRVEYFDYLRFAATAAVIVLHCAAPLLYQFNEISSVYWWTGHVYDSFTRWCVPIFFMISGALLLNPAKEEPIHRFFKKRSAKVLIPFIGWSIIYFFVQIKDGNLEPGFQNFFHAFLGDKIYYHLWFMYVIIAMYLITPIFRIFIQHATRRQIEYFLILWFVVTSIFSLIAKFYEIQIAIEVLPATGYIGYFILGYYLHRFPFREIFKSIMYVLAGISLSIILYGTYVLTLDNNGTFDGFFYHYLNTPVVLISIAVFLLFKSLRNTLSNRSRPFIQAVNKASLGIYLIHPWILLSLSTQWKIDALFIHPLFGIPLLAGLTFLISFLIISVLRKVPIVEKLVP